MLIDHLPTNKSAGFTAEPIYAYYKNNFDTYPTGQFTDGGSIIFILVFLIKRYGRHLVAFICHDIDYRYKRFSKWECDKRLYWRMRNSCGHEAMALWEENLAGKWKPAGLITIGIAFIYLNTFGLIAWLNHRLQDRKIKKQPLKDDGSGFLPVLIQHKTKNKVKFQAITTRRETMFHNTKEMAAKEWSTITIH